MKLIPGTIEITRTNKTMISVYKARVRFGKNVCRLLKIPENRIAFDFDERTQRFYVMIAADGFEVRLTGATSYQIANRNLTKKIFELLKADQRVNLEVHSQAVSPGCYLASIVNKM